MPSVLFVCTANVCRSPMAEALFRAHLQRLRSDWRDWTVESAGTWAVPGQPAALEVQKLLARRGLDASRHRSREVSAGLLEPFSLILTMEPGQKEAIRVEFPNAAARTFMLSEMSGVQVAVRDPMGEPAQAFDAAAEQIDLLLVGGIDSIFRLAGAPSQHA